MSENDREHEGEELRIKDKRRFTSEGEARKPDEESDEAWGKMKGGEKAPGEASGDKGGAEAKAEHPPGGRALPPIDFPTFILSLATSAQMHMGMIANPQTGKSETNLAVAKETIDLLEILKEKTKGNLTQEEEQLFEHLLYELRMTYVEKKKQGEQR